MRIIACKCIIPLIFVTSISAHGADYNRKISLNKKLDKFTLFTDIEYRNTNDNDRDLFHQQYDLGIKYSATKNWKLSLKYRQSYRKSSGEWDLSEKRPHIEILNKFSYTGFTIKTRFREEYRIRNNEGEFRSRLRFLMTSKNTIFNIKPFISKEFFYDHQERNYNRNRIEIGLIHQKPKAKFIPSIALRINRKYQENEDGWQDNKEILFFKIKLQY